MSLGDDTLLRLLTKYADVTGVDPVHYLDEPDNINLVIGQSAGLFVAQLPGIYVGHYLFDDRGADAIAIAETMLAEMFERRGARVILGLTPVDNRAAKLLTRRLGFTSHGEVETSRGFCELFILIDKDYEALYG